MAAKQFFTKRRAKSFVYKLFMYAAMVLMAMFTLLPFYWSLITSLRDNSEIFSTKLYITNATTEHYEFFLENSGVDLLSTLGNTIFVIVMILLFSLLFCCMGGYALARLDFKGKDTLIKFFYASMMIPGIICLIPQFIVVNFLGIDTSLWGIIVPAICSIYGCLFMRSFFVGSPKEIAEAARIDGAGEMRIFSLYLPGVLPGIITLGLFTFNSHWNSYLWPYLIVGNDPDNYVLSVAVKEFELIAVDNYGPLMAASVVTVLPMLILFISGQKYFLNNASFTGVK